jgi:hypothetical protein
MLKTLNKKITAWLTEDGAPTDIPMCDFDRIRYEIRPCDVLLTEGRSHVSDVIKYVTQSAWSHAALYLGRIHDIEDPILRNKAKEHFAGPPDTQLLIEGVLGKGTVITPLTFYRQDHIRICRPRGLSPQDAQRVIEFAINKLGHDYDVRQILDLARFMLPWPILPRKVRSSLFTANPTESTRTVCSTMIAEAFDSVHFPILPHIKKNKDTGIEMFKLNPRLFTPRDFDYSPYFDIIKYPFVSIDEEPSYRRLPWNKDGVMIRGNERRERKGNSEYEDNSELYD